MTICGRGIRRRLRHARPGQSAGRKATMVCERRISRPHDDRAAATLLHHRRSRTPRHASEMPCCDDRERHSTRAAYSTAPASGIWQFTRPRQGLRHAAELVVHGRRDVVSATTARSTICRSCMTCSATGNWRWPPTTGAKVRWQRARPATASAAAGELQQA